MQTLPATLEPIQKAIQNSIQRPLKGHPLSRLCCANRRAIGERNIWYDLTKGFGIGPTNGVFVDVGIAANMTDVQQALQLGFTVVGIEAQPQTIARLRRTFPDHLVSHSLELINIAMVASNSTLNFAKHVPSAGHQHPPFLHTKSLKDTHMTPFSTLVLHTRLDELIGSRKCAVLKLDMQGHELEALLGTLNVLTRPAGDAPLVVFKIIEKLRPDLFHLETLHLMRTLGYTCFDVSNRLQDGQRLMPYWPCYKGWPRILKDLGLYASAVQAWSKQHTNRSMPRGWGCPELATDFVCIRKHAPRENGQKHGNVME
mmetsp:Transcript_30879/g.51096  ORF Transcript_30879/g.51096 Transcript_30879/m.51096 type:complete len:314 (+) Transcript_30879:100-1041(+)